MWKCKSSTITFKKFNGLDKKYSKFIGELGVGKVSMKNNDNIKKNIKDINKK